MEDPRLAATLRYLANGAVQAIPVQHEQRYEVRGLGPYELHQDGDRVAALTTPDDVLYVLYGRAYGRALEPYLDHGWTQLHGGVVRVGDARVLFVGDKGAGKTTLALRLLFDGHGVEGDELVLTREGLALPLPRNLHVKEGSRALVPELRAHWDAMPRTRTDAGDVIRALDPTQLGLTWELRSGPIDVAVVLERGHGRAPTARPLGALELVQQVLPHAVPASSSRQQLLRGLTRLLGSADGHHLRVGWLAETAALIAGFGR